MYCRFVKATYGFEKVCPVPTNRSILNLPKICWYNFLPFKPPQLLQDTFDAIRQALRWFSIMKSPIPTPTSKYSLSNFEKRLSDFESFCLPTTGFVPTVRWNSFMTIFQFFSPQKRETQFRANKWVNQFATIWSCERWRTNAHTF